VIRRAGRGAKFAGVFRLTWAMHFVGSHRAEEPTVSQRLTQRGVPEGTMEYGDSRKHPVDDAQLRTIWQQRQFADRITHLGHPLTILMERVLKKRVRQLGKLAEIWDEILPESIRDHTALEGFERGVLTVIVDSASHRYRLKTLLSGGLLKALRERFPGALERVRLVPGQFSSVDLAGSRRYEF